MKYTETLRLVCERSLKVIGEKQRPAKPHDEAELMTFIRALPDSDFDKIMFLMFLYHNKFEFPDELIPDEIELG